MIIDKLIWRTGHRVGPMRIQLECPNGHRIWVNAHGTVPPCPNGLPGQGCLAVDWIRVA